MELKEHLTVFSGFLLAVAIGFSSLQGAATDNETFRVGAEVNSSSEISTAGFDGRQVDLFREEDSGNTTFYVDFDRDGSADRRLETVSDSSERKLVVYKELEGDIYRLIFSYRDDPEVEGEGWLRLDRARKG